jgi:hypothetical protein
MGYSYTFHEYHFGFLPKNSYIFITHLHRGFPGSCPQANYTFYHMNLSMRRRGFVSLYFPHTLRLAAISKVIGIKLAKFILEVSPTYEPRHTGLEHLHRGC